ncbi:hypothetical protein MNBD_GAMMA01-202 [hydrothermal vent metagenome]|uniref:Uncharacterized protein n=1 Tax=hydrothermal vent metagenome TaxID=652676 RepID=A0A3B0W4Q3_9ZZZZ
MNNKSSKQPTSLDSVDQIRKILFGEQINIIEQRFTQLEKSLTDTIEKLASKVQQVNLDLSSQMNKSNKQLQVDNSALAQQQSADLKNLESTINNKIIETESELLNQIQSGLEKLEQKASHRHELAKLLQDMADKLSD